MARGIPAQRQRALRRDDRDGARRGGLRRLPGLTRDNEATEVPSVDWEISLTRPVEPTADSSGWRRRSAATGGGPPACVPTPAPSRRWHLGLLTAEGKYVGIEESARRPRRPGRPARRCGMRAGKDVTLAGQTVAGTAGPGRGLRAGAERSRQRGSVRAGGPARRQLGPRGDDPGVRGEPPPPPVERVRSAPPARGATSSSRPPERPRGRGGHTPASSSPRSQRASDSARLVPPCSRVRTTSMSWSRASSEGAFAIIVVLTVVEGPGAGRSARRWSRSRDPTVGHADVQVLAGLEGRRRSRAPGPSASEDRVAAAQGGQCRERRIGASWWTRSSSPRYEPVGDRANGGRGRVRVPDLGRSRLREPPPGVGQRRSGEQRLELVRLAVDQRARSQRRPTFAELQHPLSLLGHVGHDPLGRVGRGRGAHVGDQVEDGGVGLVPDRGESGVLTACDSADQAPRRRTAAGPRPNPRRAPPRSRRRQGRGPGRRPPRSPRRRR